MPKELLSNIFFLHNKPYLESLSEHADLTKTYLTEYEKPLEEWDEASLGGDLLLANPHHEKLGPAYKRLNVDLTEFESVVELAGLSPKSWEKYAATREVQTNASKQLAVAMAVYTLLKSTDVDDMKAELSEQLDQFDNPDNKIEIPESLRLMIESKIAD